MLLFGRRVLRHAAVDIGHPEVLESGPGPGHPRHARHHLLVRGRGEAIRAPGRSVADVAPAPFHELLESLAPGQLVRGVDQHPVHVEDRALEGRSLVRHAPHRSLGLPSGAICAGASICHARWRSTASPVLANAGSRFR